jgi:hypothetical protein
MRTTLTRSALTLLALSASTTALGRTGSGALEDIGTAPAAVETEVLDTHPQLRINVNDLTSLVQDFVPDAIEDYGQTMDNEADPDTFLGDDIWLGQYTLDDDSIADEREVTPWLKDNGDGTHKLKAVCVKEIDIRIEDQQGRMFGLHHDDERKIPYDVVDLTPDGDGFIVDMNLPDFGYRGTIPVDVSLTCLWRNIEVETDSDGYVPADYDEWNITGTGFDLTLTGSLDVEVQGLAVTATAGLDMSADGLAFEGIEDIVVDFDDIAFEDIDLNYDGLLSSWTVSGSTDVDDIQDALDDLQDALEDTVDSFNRLWFVPDLASPTINRFDGMTVEEKIEDTISDSLNDSEDLQDKIAAPVDEALESILSFPLDTDSDHANLTGSVNLAGLDIAASASASGPEMGTTWDLDVELAFDAYACASGLVAPSGFSSTSTPQTDSDLDVVLDHGFIEEVVYILAKQGGLCQTQTVTDPTTGADMEITVVPSGEISVTQSPTDSDAIEISLPIAITGSGTVSSAMTVDIEATASLALTGEFDIDCDQRLLLDITDIETQAFTGTMTLERGGHSSSSAAPDLSSYIDDELVPMTESRFMMVPVTEWVFDHCIMTEVTSWEIVEDACDLCDIQVTEGMLAVPGLNRSVYIEDVVHDTDAIAIGLGFESSDICDEPSSGADYEDCLPTELEFSESFMREFDPDRYIADDMAELVAELDGRWGIESAQTFVEELLRSQSNGPIYETGEEWMYDAEFIYATDRYDAGRYEAVGTRYQPYGMR